MLSHKQQAILASYKFFYDGQYVPNNESNTAEHIKMQKLKFILNVLGVFEFEDDFQWDKYGPFSYSLQDDLIKLDESKDLIVSFYSELEKNDNKIDGNCPLNMFVASNEDMIKNLRKILMIEEKPEKTVDWIELLGSLIYLAKIEMPIASKDRIIDELKERKDKYEREEIKEAYEVLESAKLTVI